MGLRGLLGPRRRGLPTLTARVVKALMLAFALTFVVLAANELLDFRESWRAQQRALEAARAVLAQLPDAAGDDAAVQAQMRGFEGIFNDIRRQMAPPGIVVGPLQLELSTRADGRVVYASERLRRSPPPEPPGAPGELWVDGQLHGMAQASRGPWRLRLFEPALDTATLLRLVAADLVGPMLLAFPVILLPMGWAVRQGLAPLRELVRHVQQRRPDDFATMPLQLRYAELQPLEEAFNRLLAHSREALDRERGFVQDAAHELRTPLAVIATQAHALVAVQGPAARQQALRQMEAAIARASHQVHQLLTLARVEGPKLRRRVDADCVEIVRQILIDAEPRAKARQLDLMLDAPERLVLPLDLVAFHSALENLVGNALQHAQGATRVRVTLQPQGNELRLAVADDGQGVAPDERAALFERFHRGRAAQASGCGLGLAIVRESARLLGGEVHCGDGLDGRGLCFEMKLRAPARQEVPT